MTTERFYETLRYIVALDRELNLQAGIEAIAAHLASLVQSPNQPPQQQALATALESLDLACSSLRDELKPSDQEAVREVGGAEFFDPALAPSIRSQIGTNAMTPSVAANFVQTLSTRRAAFLATVKQTISGLDELGVIGRESVSGRADVAFVVPRELFDNKLEAFAKELVFFSRLISHISEATTGKAEAATLETLSSSTPTIGVLAAVGVISAIASAVNSFLDAWKKVQDFRDARARLTELGISGLAIEEVNDQITKIVDEVVETTTTTIMLHYKGESGRGFELGEHVRLDARRLFGQIERGLVVQFRAEPDADGDGSPAQQALENIERVGRNLVFPKVEASPLLLASSEILEGEITVTSSTKTVKKTAPKKVPATKA